MFKKGQYSNNVRSAYEDLLRGISRVFLIVLKGRGMGDFFLLGGGTLKSDFDHFNLFKAKNNTL